MDSLGQKFEQPEDFGTLSIDKLLRKYNKKIDAELRIKVPKKDDKLASLPSNGGIVVNEDILRNMVRRILKESLDKNVMRRLTR